MILVRRERSSRRRRRAETAAGANQKLHVLELDWPHTMIAFWRAVLESHEPEAHMRDNVASASPTESMRRLRVLVNYLFAQEVNQPACDGLVDPALEYIDRGAWSELVRRFDEEIEARGISRIELWRILASTCLSSDHENAADAIVAATAAALQLKSPLKRRLIG
jgi:hypothetical protein